MHLIAAALVAFLGPAPPRAPRRVPLVTCVTRADEHGNFVLRPPGDARPRALVHFLGGAFVGAAPHLTYATLLQTLADAGYIVVATPYELRFDHLALCDDVVERAQPTLLRLQAEHAESAAPHAALPIVGVGHSCGALLLLLLGSFFRGAASDLPPYAANALMSYNNNLASESIPLLRTVVTPLAAGILATRNDVLPSTARAAFTQARTQLSNIAQLYDAEADRARFPGSPPSVQEAAALADGLLPIIDQIEPLFEAISSGRAEFTPRPAEVLTAAPMLYATGSTLLLRSAACRPWTSRISSFTASVTTPQVRRRRDRPDAGHRRGARRERRAHRHIADPPRHAPHAARAGAAPATTGASAAACARGARARSRVD